MATKKITDFDTHSIAAADYLLFSNAAGTATYKTTLLGLLSNLTLVSETVGFTISGGTTPKTLTLDTDITASTLATVSTAILVSNLDTDGDLTANSDTKVASQKATKTYVDTTKSLLVALTGNQTVAGIKTFSSFPITPSSAPSADYEMANKKYVDDVAFAGVGAATESTPGAAELATQAETDGGTDDERIVTPKKLATTTNIPAGVATALGGKVSTTGNETVNGVKTFGSIPVLPASDPTTDNQAVRKAFVAQGRIPSFTAGEKLSAGAACFVAASSSVYLTRMKQTPLSQGNAYIGGVWTNDYGYEKKAIGIVPGVNCSISRIVIPLKKYGSPTDNFRVSIQANNAGAPSGTPLGSATVAGTALSTDFANKNFDFTAVDLTAGTQYWVVLERDGSADSENCYIASFNTSATLSLGGLSGKLHLKYGGSWEAGVYYHEILLQVVTTAGMVYNASAHETSGYNQAIGFSVAAATRGGTVDLNVIGMQTLSGLTIGSEYYLSDTFGNISVSAGTNSKKVGKAYTTTQLLINNI